MADDEQLPDDLHSVIERAYDEQAEKSAPARAEATEAPKATPDAETDNAASGERARGPDGKFIAKAETEDAPEADEAVEEPVEVEEEPVETKPAPAETPQHWSQADKDLIASLPPEHQAKVVERYKAIEAGFMPKLQRAAQIEKEWAPAAEVFAPYMHALRAQNQTPSDVVKAWAAVELDLVQGNQKAAARIATLISHYKVDPAQVAEFLTNPQAAQMPAVTGAYGEVPPAVMREIEGLKAREAAREEAERNTRVMTAQQQIDAFAAEKDSAGNLTHPHFATVEAKMDLLARGYMAAGAPIPALSALYDEAVFANPETRSKLLAAHEAEIKQNAAAARKAKAEASQRAASSVTGSPGGGQAQRQPTEPRSLREEIEAAYEEHQAA